MTFSPDIYAVIRDGAIRSANEVAPLVYSRLGHPRSVIDVGCGEGWWARAFAELGCIVVGIDESITVETIAETDTGVMRFLPGDLTGDAWAHPDLRSDLAVCLEVAEHLPAGVGAGLVRTLCELAPLVLFSAAIPGQGGHGHLNEQWLEYWRDRFLECGYVLHDGFRDHFWNDPNVEPWYAQNLVLFGRDSSLAALDLPIAYTARRLVHPTIYEARLAERDRAWAQLRAMGATPS